MDSLTSTFATVLPISSDPTEFMAKDEDVFAGQQFQDQISDIFLTTIPVAKVEVVQPVKKLRATFPIESMFAPDSYRLRPVSILLLDQIVAALSLSPDGVRLELEFVVRAEYLAENVFPIDQT